MTCAISQPSCDSLMITEDELDLVLGGSSNPSHAQGDNSLPAHAEHVGLIVAAGTALGSGLGAAGGAAGGFLAAGPPGAAAGAIEGAQMGGLAGGAFGAMVAVGYEAYEHTDSVSAGFDAAGASASGAFDSGASYGQQLVADAQQFGHEAVQATNAVFAEHGQTLYTSVSQQNGF